MTCGGFVAKAGTSAELGTSHATLVHERAAERVHDLIEGRPLDVSHDRRVHGAKLLPVTASKLPKRNWVKRVERQPHALVDIRRRVDLYVLSRRSDVPIEVHHVNGDPTDNRIGNLVPLCRDCHRSATFPGI